MNKKIVIIGATSRIAEETARIFALKGDSLFLLARNQEKLAAVSRDLKVRGAGKVGQFVLDLNDFSKHEEALLQAEEFMGGMDIVLIAHGILGDPKRTQGDVEAANEVIQTNFLSVMFLLTLLAKRFEEKKQGCIAVISSVAGDRGRKSNYVYGTSKAALNTYLQGLRGRLAPYGISVITIKPGFVDTPMTENMKKGPLFSSPKTIAKGIVHAIEKKKDVVYLPGYWRLMMGIIKTIPEGIFKKLNL